MTHKFFVFFTLSLAALLVWANLDDPLIYRDSDGRALAGYDPVSYFFAAAAVPGRSDYRFRWHGAEWWFASDENRVLFQAEPRKYMPAYGGYAALQVAQGRKIIPDPEIWQVADGRLYLFADQPAQQRFQRGADALLQAAERVWPRIADRQPNGAR